MADLNQILAGMPTDFFNLGDDNHAVNTANFSTLYNAVTSVNAVPNPVVNNPLPNDPLAGDPIKMPPIPQTEVDKFGNWLGTTDTKSISSDLSKRGLVGADQLVNEVQDTSSADSIKNKNQSDWKVAAIEKMVGNARRMGIKTPEAITANWNTLIGNKDLADAINNDSFKKVHPNFPEIVKGIIKDQWAKLDKQNSVATNNK